MFQLQCEKGIVEGKNGVCFFYKDKPKISISIKGDKYNTWVQGDDFLLDSGADSTILHSDEADELGLDIRKYDDRGFSKGVGGISIPIYYKYGIMIKIGDFLPISLPIAFSPKIAPGLRILGRQTIFKEFGIAFNGGKIGIFSKL
ncbi:MAG: hypothetical protein GY795_30605 [Desulfobacterales bacterium]|nr:hypothetical protein [Desulfobacterales bacterium]